MTETMILIALLSMAAGALLMELIHKIADLIRLNRALKEEEQEKACVEQRHKAIIRELIRGRDME